MPARLLGRDQELYGAYDRLNAEAEFRTGSALPLLATGIACYMQVDPSVGTSIITGAALVFVSGMKRASEASLLLLEAIRAGRLESSVLEDAQGIVDRWEKVIGDAYK
ncbi:hypothetical protein Pth03_28500 [Planotetraspora thailandica]|uniref:Uncharacterized protein n=2 Tax=Planotetraspora thailandica TaxID=487172 RepID=A0A8J3V0M7_9ACTN|nr:hypothetical protein Pth03_28500 [Planotetraspora thailandica]